MGSFKRRATITRLQSPAYGYQYNVQIWTSLDNGKTWWYAGIGRDAKTEEEARKIVQEYRKQTIYHGYNEECKIIWED